MFRISFLLAMMIMTGLLPSCKPKPYKTYKNTVGIPPSEFAMMDTPFYTRIAIDTAFNFGTITQGDSVNLQFKYANEGDNLLFFDLIYPSCGCTVPEFPSAPAYPGDRGVLQAIYHSREDTGFVRKTIKIHTNTSNGIERILSFRGRVNKKIWK